MVASNSFAGFIVATLMTEQPQRPTPQRCLEAFHLQLTRFEMIAERKLRRRQLTETADVEITGRDLRERMPPIGQGSLLLDAFLLG